jgi:FAD/FMN-containing dehydrogenase
MSKIVSDLTPDLAGYITAQKDVREYFSTDGSIFKIEPTAVVYPKNEADVIKVVKYVAAQAAEGNVIGITPRGKGTDQGGGALGSGIMMAFPAYMSKMIRLERNRVTVQPGVNYQLLQDVLHAEQRFLPPYPSSIAWATMGGAVANNSCGEKTYKYGSTRHYVESMKIVLSDGSLITTRKLTPRELSKKKGQNDLEGHLYRQVDHILSDHKELISKMHPHTTKSSSGYSLWRIRDPKDGTFDLGQLFVGSQGTLGIVTEITFKTVPYNPTPTLIAAYFDDIKKAGEAVVRLKALGASAIELVDENLLKFLLKHKPGQLDGLLPEQLPKIVFLVEFDDASSFKRGIKARRALRILKKLTYSTRISNDVAEQERLWKIRHSAAAVIWMNDGPKKALPIIEDGCVPSDKIPEFLEKVYKLFAKYGLESAVWGHAGDGDMHMQPFFDLSKKLDREKVFELADDYYNMVIKMGGTTCGEHNDGLIRAPYLKKLFGKDMYHVFQQIKETFDPYNVMNPQVKMNVEKADIIPLVRHEYSMKHLYDHMPHT